MPEFFEHLLTRHLRPEAAHPALSGRKKYDCSQRKILHLIEKKFQIFRLRWFFTDHLLGAAAFTGENNGSVDVYAHETTEYYINRVVNIIRPGLEKRTNKMFGSYLPKGPESFVNAGLDGKVYNGYPLLTHP